MFTWIHVTVALVAVISLKSNTIAMAVTNCADYFAADYCPYMLHWAALSGDVKGAMDAIKLGSNIDEDIPGFGTPLHQASFYGRANMVKLLLQHGANVAATDLDGDTPIRTTDIKWCSARPKDKICHRSTIDYRETIHLLTAGCKSCGCSEEMQCQRNQCVNLCAKISCGFNAVCTIHNDQAKCRCNGEDYSGDPSVMCLKLGEEGMYIYKAYCFVSDIVTQISTAIISDIKSIVY